MNDSGTPVGADFGIVTILPETYDSVKRIFGLNEFPVRDGYQWAQGTVTGRLGQDLNIVAGSPLDQENLAAVGFVDSMLRAWAPGNLLVVDIGGGVKGRDEIGLGDVVVHTELHYYDHNKIGADGAEVPRSTLLAPPSPKLRELARRPSDRGEAAWVDLIASARPGDGSPKVVAGEVLTGGTLLSKSERLDGLLKRYPRVLAAEMDGGGGARAVYDAVLRTRHAEFLIVRGISDFCNEPAEVNQQTRDAWRLYAAETAAAFARTIVGEAEDGASAAVGGAASSRQSTEAGRRGTGSVVGDPWPKLPSDSTDGHQFFDLNFEIGEEACSIADLEGTLREIGRLALLGSAGTGKTFAALRTLRACQLKMPVVFVEAEAWTRGLSERLSLLPKADGTLDWQAGLDAILREASVDVSLLALEGVLADGRLVTLGVDGINSATTPAANVALEVLDLAVRQWNGLAAIVTDRSRARYEALHRWTAAFTTDLADDLIRRKIDERHGEGTWAAMPERAQRLLSSPLFLDGALRADDPESHSRSEALTKLADRIDPKARDALIEATAIAFAEDRRDLPADASLDGHRHTISDAGLIIDHASGDGRLAFAHDLYGDYFASLYLVRQADKWPINELNAISFSRERWKFEGLSADTDNFDAITLAAEQMPRKAGDSFLRAVYDWNWRAAVDCLYATEPDKGPFSEEARLVVLALLSERCADPVDGTRKRALRLLDCLPDPAAAELARARDALAARQIIARYEFDAEWFPAWQAIFCRDDERPWSEEEVGSICQSDTLHGWTVSYALKRAPLSAEACRQLIGIYQGCLVDAEDEPTLPASIRWRVIHSLAAGDGEYLLPLLLSALDEDPYNWVRWEAARSLTEFAARAADPERSARAIDALRDRAGKLSIAIAHEIARAALYRGAVPHFSKLMEPLLDDLERNVRGDVNIAQWRNRRADFDSFWGQT
jgi:nucleoside phosphorylase